MDPQTRRSDDAIALLFERIRAELTQEQAERLKQATEQLPD